MENNFSKIESEKITYRDSEKKRAYMKKYYIENHEKNREKIRKQQAEYREKILSFMFGRKKDFS